MRNETYIIGAGDPARSPSARPRPCSASARTASRAFPWRRPAASRADSWVGLRRPGNRSSPTSSPARWRCATRRPTISTTALDYKLSARYDFTPSSRCAPHPTPASARPRPASCNTLDVTTTADSSRQPDPERHLPGRSHPVAVGAGRGAAGSGGVRELHRWRW